MRTVADAVIDHLGGTSAVAELLECPVSTVHSWRTNGIPKWRLALLRISAKAGSTPLPEDLTTLLSDEERAAVALDAEPEADAA